MIKTLVKNTTGGHYVLLCDTCGKQFRRQISYARKKHFCSQACYRGFRSKTTKYCVWCGKEICGAANRSTTKYCSQRCNGLSRIKPRPIYKDFRSTIGEEECRCLVCGTTTVTRNGRTLPLTGLFGHLKSHGITAAEYKEEFGFNRSQGLCSEVVSAKKAKKYKELGLHKHIRNPNLSAGRGLNRRLQGVLNASEALKHPETLSRTNQWSSKIPRDLIKEVQ